MLASVPEEIRPQVTARVNSQLLQFKNVQDAEAVDQQRQYVQYAKQQGWTPQQAADQVDLAENLNPSAKEWLKKFYQGKVNKETPENREAKGILFQKLDIGPENGGLDPSDEVTLKAECKTLGLTFHQTDEVLDYARKGGAAGSLTATMFDSAYKMLHPDVSRKDLDKARGEMMVLITEHMVDPGKKFTVDDVRKVISILETRGEDPNRFSLFGKGRDVTYAEYLREGGSKPFELEEDEFNRIAARLKELGQDVNSRTVLDYYKEEKRRAR